jgi:hypothetical protein
MTTSVVYADNTPDGDVEGRSATYSIARSTAYAAQTTYMRVGQDSFFKCWEGFDQFNTSGIGTDTISSATLSLYGQSASVSQNFTIEARIFDWGASLTTADYVSGSSLGSLTLVAHWATVDGWSTVAYTDFYDDALAANINKSGQTYLLFNSDRHRIGNQPITIEYVWVNPASTDGTTKDPKLTIVHAAAASLFLILEDGSGAYEKEDSSGGIVLEA